MQDLKLEGATAGQDLKRISSVLRWAGHHTGDLGRLQDREGTGGGREKARDIPSVFHRMEALNSNACNLFYRIKISWCKSTNRTLDYFG